MSLDLLAQQLHLAHLTFIAGQEDAALAHLKEHLSWHVQRGRDTCDGCGQTKGEDTPMLTCSGCRVARFCSADHQKMASEKTALGGNLLTGRHNDICGVLSKWREVVKDGCCLTRALRTWWRFCSDECAMPQRHRRGARRTLCASGPCGCSRYREDQE